MLLIKPHHFIDIITAYGNDVMLFKPDMILGNALHGVASDILSNPDVELCITVDGDAICAPCRKLSKEGFCLDAMLNHSSGLTSKEEWNKRIDHRILRYANLLIGDIYSAQQLCRRLYDIRAHLDDIWKEHTEERKAERYKKFSLGAEKYLQIHHEFNEEI